MGSFSRKRKNTSETQPQQPEESSYALRERFGAGALAIGMLLGADTAQGVNTEHYTEPKTGEETAPTTLAVTVEEARGQQYQQWNRAFGKGVEALEQHSNEEMQELRTVVEEVRDALPDMAAYLAGETGRDQESVAERFSLQELRLRLRSDWDRLARQRNYGIEVAGTTGAGGVITIPIEGREGKLISPENLRHTLVHELMHLLSHRKTPEGEPNRPWRQEGVHTSLQEALTDVMARHVLRDVLDEEPGMSFYTSHATAGYLLERFAGREELMRAYVDCDAASLKEAVNAAAGDSFSYDLLNAIAEPKPVVDTETGTVSFGGTHAVFLERVLQVLESKEAPYGEWLRDEEAKELGVARRIALITNGGHEQSQGEALEGVLVGDWQGGYIYMSGTFGLTVPNGENMRMRFNVYSPAIESDAIIAVGTEGADEILDVIARNIMNHRRENSEDRLNVDVPVNILDETHHRLMEKGKMDMGPPTKIVVQTLTEARRVAEDLRDAMLRRFEEVKKEAS